MKFAIGLNPLEYCNNSLDYFTEFVKKNNYRIQHWYTSPPMTWCLKNVTVQNKRAAKKNFKKQLQIIKENGQQIQLAINQDFRIPIVKQLFALFLLVYFILFYSKIDSVVTLDCYIPIFRFFFPKLFITYSTQNDFKYAREKCLKQCDAIVIGNKWIRSLSFMKKMKEKYGLKIELLLNCACHSLCDARCAKGINCNSLQDVLIEKEGLNWCVAQQSIIPSELKYYPEGLVDFYKLSTRPAELSWIHEEMDLYEKEEHLPEIFSYCTPRDFWGRVCGTRALNRYFTQQMPSELRVVKIKNSLWSRLLKKDIKIW